MTRTVQLTPMPASDKSYNLIRQMLKEGAAQPAPSSLNKTPSEVGV
ncbi:hypothetical protein [Neptunomonas sp.]|nr:hypothetical protein [Neptunomonas sp.]